MVGSHTLIQSDCLGLLIKIFMYTYVFKRKWTEDCNSIDKVDKSQCRDILPYMIKFYPNLLKLSGINYL